MPIIIALLTIISTFLGGLFTLRFKDKLHMVLGFSAGAVIGVAFFDLLPEAIELASSRFETGFVTALIALGFVVFMIIDRVFSIHMHDDEHCENLSHRGRVGAITLAVHSFLDGVAIGLAFQVSAAVGAVVAAAVLAHDFSDGINTVNVVLKNKGSQGQALKWLALDAIAPALGALSTLLFTMPEATLGLILALFCGFFLYIGASDLLPESHHRHPSWATTLATVAGMGLLYGIIRVAGI